MRRPLHRLLRVAAAWLVVVVCIPGAVWACVILAGWISLPDSAGWDIRVGVSYLALLGGLVAGTLLASNLTRRLGAAWWLGPVSGLVIAVGGASGSFMTMVALPWGPPLLLVSVLGVPLVLAALATPKVRPPRGEPDLR